MPNANGRARRATICGPGVRWLGLGLDAEVLLGVLTVREPRVAKTLNKTEPNPDPPNYFGMRDDEAALGEIGRKDRRTTRRVR